MEPTTVAIIAAWTLRVISLGLYSFFVLMVTKAVKRRGFYLFDATFLVIEFFLCSILFGVSFVFVPMVTAWPE